MYDSAPWEPFARRPLFWIEETETAAMLSLDSYHNVLSERIRRGHVVLSAWFIVVAAAVFLIAMA
jgi:hypothetical protein